MITLKFLRLFFKNIVSAAYGPETLYPDLINRFIAGFIIFSSSLLNGVIFFASGVIRAGVKRAGVIRAKILEILAKSGVIF